MKPPCTPTVKAARAFPCFLAGFVAVVLMTIRSQAEGPYFTSAENPFYTKKDVVLDPRLVGRWHDVEEDAGKCLQIEKCDARSYSVKCECNTNEVWVAHLFKLKSRCFLDLQFVEADSSTHPEYMLLRVEEFAPSLKFARLSEKRIGELLDGKPFVLRRWLGLRGGPLRHNASELLAAPTKELRAFLLAHFDDPKLFEKPVEFRRVPGATDKN